MSATLAKALGEAAPAEADEFDSQPVRALAALCRELQRGAGKGPFFLSCRTTGRLFDVDHTTAWRWLFLLTAEGLLEVVQVGTQAERKATRWRWLGKL